MKYTATVCMKNGEEVDTLKKAVCQLIQKVNSLVESGEMNYQLLEACWIASSEGYCMDFYRARELAADEGWIDNEGNLTAKGMSEE